MKILLINPGFSYRTPWLQVTEPLGILYLASYIRKYSHHKVSILDCTNNNRIKKTGSHKYWYGLTTEETLRTVEANNPDIIGITCMFSRKKDDFFECASAIRKKFPNKLLVGGGIYPSLFPEDLIADRLFDYCIIGEGEKSLLDLLNSISTDNAKKDIDGLAFLDNNKVTIMPRDSYIEDLDRIPFPSRDLIDYDAYAAKKNVLHGLGLGRSASILTSRSCPNRCNFCSMFKIHGPRWRGRSAKNVFDEIVELKKGYGIEDIFVMDDNFTFEKDRVMEICGLILQADLKIRWNTPNGISINTLDKELLTAMKASGCKSICIAIESGDEELRNKVIGKRLRDDNITQIAKYARELDIFTTAFYILGMPGETEEKFQKTLKQLKELPFNAVTAAFANPLPGAKLYQDCIDNNWTILNYDKEKDNILYKPYIVTGDFSEEDLLSREKRFYMTFLRYKFFTIINDTLSFRNKLFHLPFLMRILTDRLARS